MGRSPQRAEGLRGAAPQGERGTGGAVFWDAEQSEGLQALRDVHAFNWGVVCKTSQPRNDNWYNLGKNAFTTPRTENSDFHWSLQLPTYRCIPGAAPST